MDQQNSLPEEPLPLAVMLVPAVLLGLVLGLSGALGVAMIYGGSGAVAFFSWGLAGGSVGAFGGVLFARAFAIGNYALPRKFSQVFGFTPIGSLLGIGTAHFLTNWFGIAPLVGALLGLLVGIIYSLRPSDSTRGGVT